MYCRHVLETNEGTIMVVIIYGMYMYFKAVAYIDKCKSVLTTRVYRLVQHLCQPLECIGKCNICANH